MRLLTELQKIPVKIPVKLLGLHGYIATEFVRVIVVGIASS